MIKLLFSTDLHGSEVCFRKFLNAAKIYNVDAGIIQGDLCGKMINPIIRQPDGKHVVEVFGNRLVLKTEEELKEAEKQIAASGNYFFYTDPAQVEELKAEGKTIEGRIDERASKISLSSGKIEELFKRLVTERLASWLKLAEERLAATKIKLFMAPGNDDILDLDPLIRGSSYVVNPDRTLVEVLGHPMITLSWSNPTPWQTPRECSDEKLGEMIGELTAQVTDMEGAIFNFHAPPYNTMLDQCPKLSEDLVPSTNEIVSVGSQAVHRAIEEKQPLLGLHGHIHESRAVQKIGRTTCINPGSEYSEAVLRGVLISLDKNKVKNYQFISG